MRSEPGDGRPSEVLVEPWIRLYDAAVEASRTAYAPYSSYFVGAAALIDDGRIVTGCNVENASYGLTLCAECVLIGLLHAGGGGRWTALVCVNGRGSVIMPCGRCRQVLIEHAAPDARLLTHDGEWTMAQVLPGEWGREDLDGTRG